MRVTRFPLPASAVVFVMAAIATIAITAPAKAVPSAAPGTYYFHDATFAGGGSLTGSFTVNSSSVLTTFDILTGASGSFTGFEYTNANSTGSVSGTGLTLNNNASTYHLALAFSSSLASGAAPLTTSSSETQASSARNLTSGGNVNQVSAAPEPGSAALILGAAGLPLFGMLRKRKR